ncbi:AraC family transcriptional regulator [Mycobacterium sp. 1423905.2]|nr:AraC family transcriptional regulator [Mycobacterium sp. 1423905.2]
MHAELLRTRDLNTARRFFARAYRPGWRISGMSGESAITHSRCAAASLTIDEVTIEGRVAAEIPPGESLIVLQPLAGEITVSGERQAQSSPLLSTQGLSAKIVEFAAARFGVVSIPPALVHRIAAARHTPLPPQMKFVDCHPRSAPAARIWCDCLDFVTARLASADTAQHPLMLNAFAELLAAAVFECFPSNVTAEQDLLNDPTVPKAVHAALSFIHRHAGDDIGVNDVAAAVHLTPRAVQYLFRQQLDTTPTEYLRRVRLHRAHQALLGADRSTATVGDIAQRWGFTHTGRFAVLYRQTYGQSPHSTLENAVTGVGKAKPAPIR